MLVGYFGLTPLHTQKEASDAWVKLGDGSLLPFLDGEVRPSSWAYYPRSEQVDRIPPFSPPCPPVWRHGDVKKKARDGVSLAFGIAGLRLPLGARAAGY